MSIPVSEYSDRLPGAEFLVVRYQAAAAIPAAERTHDIAAFLRSYELVGDVVHTLPWVEATPPAPAPLPPGVLCTCLLKYLLANHICVGPLVYPGHFVPRVFAQLWPLWSFQLAFPGGPAGAPAVSGVPSPAFEAACFSPAPITTDKDGSLLLPLLRVLTLGFLLSTKPPLYAPAQCLLEKAAALLSHPSSAAKLRRELAALPPDAGSNGSGNASSSSSGSGSSGSGSGSSGSGPLMSVEELESMAQWLIVEVCVLRMRQMGVCQEAFALLDLGKAAAARMVAVAPDDPTSYYTASKMAKEFGELDKSLTYLQRSLAIAEGLDSPFYIAQYTLSVGFCSVQVFDERCEELLPARPRAAAAARRKLAQNLSSLLAQARGAMRRVKGLLPQPALESLKSQRHRLEALLQLHSGGEATMSPEELDAARVPSAAENRAGDPLRQLPAAGRGRQAVWRLQASALLQPRMPEGALEEWPPPRVPVCTELIISEYDCEHSSSGRGHVIGSCGCLRRASVLNLEASMVSRYYAS